MKQPPIGSNFTKIAVALSIVAGLGLASVHEDVAKFLDKTDIAFPKG